MEKYTVKEYKGNLQCNWCDKKAEYIIRDNHVQWTDHACKDHLEKWFPKECVIMYQEKKSYIQELHERTGWPLKIKARGFIACLIGEQQLLEGRSCPIYRFPGGDNLVDECEMIPIR